MKQCIQNFKTGKLLLEDVPRPALEEGFVLVENRFSLISFGTEKSTVKTGKASLVGKAKRRPDLVKQVMQNIKKEGVFATLQKVKTKLDTPKALGYSCAGLVYDSKDFTGRFVPGDRVACAGQDYASHAEVVAVPENLVVKIPESVSFQKACFTTLGAIALQSVRQADARIQEKICVIGLGLLGQITHQLLKANGCSVCGVDISDFLVDLARKTGIDAAFNRNDTDFYKYTDSFTAGYGFDKVIITASSFDNDPIILATEILRKKGIIVVVGDVKMDIPRNPHFYRKELELKISTSYGPGRYDPLYEEAGIDYPYSYVRFTENRNMQDFIGLLAKGSINITPLITHVFDFSDALSAYELMSSKTKKKPVAVLLKYSPFTEEKLSTRITVNSASCKDINIGFIGAGSFAQSYLLPKLVAMPVSLDTVVTRNGINAKNAASKFGFNCASVDAGDILDDERINTVFIATRHNTHASYLCRALENKKNVFIEKPLALTLDELKDIVSVYKGDSIMTVGFNRRFSPVSIMIKEKLKLQKTPILMNFRINAGFIDSEHWIQNPDIGGGRIIGEVCHFVDLMMYFSSSHPVGVFARSLRPNSNKWRPDDNIVVTIEFADGSAGTITYTASGSKEMPKERLEIFSSGTSYLIDDFKKAVFYNQGRPSTVANRGKGHSRQLDVFIDAVQEAKSNPIDFESLLYSALATFKIVASLRNNRPEPVSISELY